MYLDGLSFLEDERDAWRPYEALEALSDDQLARPVAAAHGWSGRELIAHLVGWQETALAAARDLAVGETSASMARTEAAWEERGDALNDELLAAWATLPMDEVRRRFREVPGELRGYLTVVPEARWVKNASNFGSIAAETLEHYDDHLDDLRAILAAAAGA
jgi:hypothetical protein